MTNDQLLPTDMFNPDVYLNVYTGVVIGFALCALLVWACRRWKGGKSK